MKFGKLILLSGILMIPFLSNGQRMWKGAYNRLGLEAGVNHFNVVTNQLSFSPRESWTAGFTTRSSFYSDFQFIYGIKFYDFNAEVMGREKLDDPVSEENIGYNMIGVQGNFFGSYKIFDHHLSIEVGPVLQVNGKLEPRQNRELWYIEDYDFIANDLRKVSPFNFNLALGLSGGFEKLKFWAQYQHGLNNFLSGLNDGDLLENDPSAPNFNGRISMIAAGIAVFL